MPKLNLAVAFTFVFLSIFSFKANAQYTQVGNGLFSDIDRGPMVTTTDEPSYNKSAFIYPAGCLTNLIHGDTIKAIEFMVNSLDSMIGNPSLKIYLRNTAATNFGAGVMNWNAVSRTSNKVFDGNPQLHVNGIPGFVRFDFNSTPYHVFDTTGGAVNLEVLVEYIQVDSQLNDILWFIESQFSVPAFNSPYETKYLQGNDAFGTDSFAFTSSMLKPTIRFIHPRYAKEFEVRKIYALGSVGTLMDRPDSIKVSVQNIGKETITNHKVYLNISGSNTHSDSITIASIDPYDEQVIVFPNHQPDTLGRETIFIQSEADSIDANDTVSVNRLVNYNRLSHNNPYEPISGGIGFPDTTGDFVAKFYVNGTQHINQISVQFTSVGRGFQLGIWNDDRAGGLPGTILFMSDSLTTQGGTYILPVLPRVQVTGSFYIGIRQTSNSNVAFAYQEESPVRPDAFFFAGPSGDTSWVPFSPGFNFNFGITPRLQVGNDLSVLEVVNPPDNDSIEYKFGGGQIVPQAKVINYGFIDQNGFVPVKADIFNRFGVRVYTNTKFIMIDSDSTVLVTFDTFNYQTLGRYRMEVYTDFNLDSVKENNRLTTNFDIFIRHDVSLPIVYDPGDGLEYELQDFVWPSIFISNNGVTDQANFPIVMRMSQAGSIFFQDTILATIAGLQSTILNFDSVQLTKEGQIDFEFYTDLYRDSFPNNDTTRISVNVRKKHDVLPVVIRVPKDASIYGYNQTISPLVRVRNDGLESEDSVYFYLTITGPSGTQVFGDTVIKAIQVFQNTDVSFNDFNTGTNGGIYKVLVEAYLERDQLEINDTLSSYFEVRRQYDAYADQQTFPVANDTLNLFTSSNLTAIVGNSGFDTMYNAEVYLEVQDSNDITIYSDTLTGLTLPATETISVASSSVVDFDSEGAYIYLTKVFHPLDETSGNDELTSPFQVELKIDIEIDSIELPTPEQMLNVKSNYGPIAIIRNNGKRSTGDVTLVCRAFVGSTQIYSANLNTTFSPESVKTISFDNTLSYDFETTDARLEVVTLSSDVIPSNDSLSVDFEFVKTIGVDVVQADKSFAVYPNPLDGNSFNVQSLNSIRSIKVYNQLGQIVPIQKITKNKQGIYSVDLNVSLKPGVYSLQVEFESGTATKQLLKY